MSKQLSKKLKKADHGTQYARSIVGSALLTVISCVVTFLVVNPSFSFREALPSFVTIASTLALTEAVITTVLQYKLIQQYKKEGLQRHLADFYGNLLNDSAFNPQRPLEKRNEPTPT
jgi:hypothetical protein